MSRAEISLEQLDSTNFLLTHLLAASQDVTTQNVPGTPNAYSWVRGPWMQVAEFQQNRHEQSQTSPAPIRRETMLNFNWGGIAPVNLGAQVDKKMPQSSLLLAPNPNSLLKHQLYKDRISIPKSQKDNRSKIELQQIIEQIRSIKFEPKSQTAQPLITLEPPTTTEPNGTLSAAEATEESEKKEIESKLPYVPVTDRTLQMLQNLSQHPDQLKNPLELAELLFLSGHLKEAVVFYRQALNRWNPDQLSSAQNRPWILFQIGNCLRDDDPPEAMKMYRQLITEYPGAPWTDLAKARDKLIDWYRKDKPRTLIAECQF